MFPSVLWYCCHDSCANFQCLGSLLFILCVADVRQGINKIAGMANEPKNVDVRRTAARVLHVLHLLNEEVFMKMMAALPRNMRVSLLHPVCDAFVVNVCLGLSLVMTVLSVWHVVPLASLGAICPNSKHSYSCFCFYYPLLS